MSAIQLPVVESAKADAPNKTDKHNIDTDDDFKPNHQHKG